jgi:hypothetical protein
MQAMTGIATTTMISGIAANWDSLRNTSILLSRKFPRKPLDGLPAPPRARPSLLLTPSLLLWHVFLKPSKRLDFFALFQIPGAHQG